MLHVAETRDKIIIISDFCRRSAPPPRTVQKTGGKKSIVRQSYNWPNELAAKAAAKATAVAETEKREGGRGGTDWRRRKSEFLFHISSGRCKITDARDGWTDDGFTGSLFLLNIIL